MDYQYVAIDNLARPELPVMLNYDAMKNGLRSSFNQDKRKIEREGGNWEKFILNFRENLVYQSEEYIGSKILSYNAIYQLLNRMREENIEIQIQTKTYNTDDNVEFNIIGLYYSRIYQINDNNQLSVRELANRILGSDLYIPVTLKNGLGLDGLKIIRNRDRIMVKSRHLDNCFSLNQQLFEKLLNQFNQESGEQNLPYKETDYSIINMDGNPIYLPDRLHVTSADNFTTNRLVRSMQHLKVVKIGGYQPEGYTSISSDDFKLNLLDLMEEPPQFYVPILTLIEELFQIYNFAQTFKMFFDLYQDSLSQEQSEKMTIKHISQTLKEVPLSSFEIPIDIQTKTILNQFFLQFHYNEYLENKYDNTFPEKLHIPVIKGMNSDILVLLLMIIINSNLESSGYDILLVENDGIRQYIFKDRVIPHINEILKKPIIFLDNNPYRKDLEQLPKLFLHPSQNVLNYLNEKYEKISPSGIRCYFSPYPSRIDEVQFTISHSIAKMKRDLNDEIGQLLDDSFDGSKIENTFDSEHHVSEAVKISNRQLENHQPVVEESEDIDGFIDKLKATTSDPKDQTAENEVMEVEEEKICASSDDHQSELKPREEKSSSRKEKSVNTLPMLPSTSLIQSPKEINNPQQENTPKEYVPSLPAVPLMNKSKKKEVLMDDQQFLQVFENLFNIRSLVSKTDSSAIRTMNVINIIEDGTYNFSVLSRLINASTSKLDYSKLEPFEQNQLQFLKKKNLVQVESTGQYFITDKGRKMVTDLISLIKSMKINNSDLDMVLNHTDELLGLQKEYGLQTYVHTRMKMAILLGIKYYNQFKIMPPLILSIFNLYEKLKFFKIADPEEFTSLFDAKFVVLLEDYRTDLEKDISRIREAYIDIDDTPVPRPRSDSEEDTLVSRDDILLDLDGIQDRTIIPDISPVFKKKVKIIDADGNQSLPQENFLRISEVKFPKLKNGTTPKDEDHKDDKPFTLDDLGRYNPMPLSPLNLSAVLDELHDSFVESTNNATEEIQFVLDEEEFISYPVIYTKDRSGTIDLDTFFKKPVKYLNIQTRIRNIIFADDRLESMSIEEFRTTEYSTEISGIGTASIKKIHDLQRLLSSELHPKDLILLVRQEFQPLFIHEGAEINPSWLPRDIFFALSEYVQFPFGDECQNIEKLVVPFIEFLLEMIYHIDPRIDIDEEDSRLSALITSLTLYQKERYPILLNLEDEKISQQYLRFDDIYRVIDQFEVSDNKNEVLNGYKQELKDIFQKIYVNSSIFKD